MNFLLFAVKKALRSPAFWIFLAAILFAPPALRAVGNRTGMPGAGYVVEDAGDASAERMAELLEEAGFLAYPDVPSMENAVENGTLDVGVVLPEGLSNKLREGRYEGALQILESPTALYPEIRREQVTAALFSVYAPFITAEALAGSGIDEDAVFSEYATRTDDANDRLFTFRFFSVKGQALPASVTGERFTTGALALLIYLAVYFAAVSPLFRGYRDLSMRTGKKKALRAYLLPGLFIRLLFFFAAAAVSCLIAGAPALIPAVSVYLAAVTLIHCLFMLLPDGQYRDIAVLFIAAAGLALSPVYLDLSLFWKPVATLRLFLPPNLLFLFVSLF